MSPIRHFVSNQIKLQSWLLRRNEQVNTSSYRYKSDGGHKKELKEADLRGYYYPNTEVGIKERSVKGEPVDPIQRPYPPFPDAKNPQTGEVGGPTGPEPTRFGDWERKGRVTDF